MHINVIELTVAVIILNDHRTKISHTTKVIAAMTVLSDLWMECRKLHNYSLENIVPMAEKLSFIGATTCHICAQPFADSDITVTDHYHFAGLPRGFSHQKCNAKFRKLYLF